MITNRIEGLAPIKIPLAAYQFKAIIINDDSFEGGEKKGLKKVQNLKEMSNLSFESISPIKGKVKTKKMSLLGYNSSQKSVIEGVEYDDVTFSKAVFPFLDNTTSWFFNTASEISDISKKNILVLAIDQNLIPLFGIQLKGCLPVSFEVGEFNASNNKILMEKMTFSIESAVEHSINGIIGNNLL